MEKRVSDFNDEVWTKFKRSKNVSKKRSLGNSKSVKARKTIQSDRLDDMKLFMNICILLLKFFVLLNVLVITSRMM